METSSPIIEEKIGKGFKRWPLWIGYGAAGWSLLYGVVQLYWLLGGAGYPFKHAEMDLFAAMVTYLPSKAGGLIFVIFCLLGTVIGVAMQKMWRGVLLRWLFLTFAWCFAVVLLLFIPDISLIAVMAYAFLFKFAFNWIMFNQIICIIGALLWILTAIAYQRRTRDACEYCGRTENGNTFLLVRWGRWLTIIAALAPIPYALTRFAWALNIPLGVDQQFFHDFSKVNSMAQITEWVFGSVCVGGGILTLGLIQKWGEIFPCWFPFIGGKRVPIMLAVVPASIVAIAVTAAGFVFTFNFLAVILHFMPADILLLSQIWGTIGPMIFWVPWGVALGLAAIAYYYRRRGKCTHCGRDDQN
ncbi:hypothetical protein SAMN04488168_15217 [Bacillus sp. 491mf]|uniref:hypothetical protein n=1 Tax=Bacillus TaxID=1386 RepID=UPI000691148E|nr:MULTISPECIES: hypothetical protein [unclassified Bacillus (in: firmicutes)]SFD56752.1 hypothetical protein SAMN04488168_15217 [Bacillus sp. 491mf]